MLHGSISGLLGCITCASLCLLLLLRQRPRDEATGGPGGRGRGHRQAGGGMCEPLCHHLQEATRHESARLLVVSV